MKISFYCPQNAQGQRDRQTNRQRGRLCGSDTIDVIQTTFSTYENVMRELGGPHSSSSPTTYSKCIILSIYSSSSSSSSSSGVGQAIESQAKGTTKFFLSLSLFIHLHVRIVPPGSRVSTEIRQYYYIPVHLLFFIICVIIGTSQRNAWHEYPWMFLISACLVAALAWLGYHCLHCVFPPIMCVCC